MRGSFFTRLSLQSCYTAARNLRLRYGPRRLSIFFYWTKRNVRIKTLFLHVASWLHMRSARRLKRKSGLGASRMMISRRSRGEVRIQPASGRAPVIARLPGQIVSELRVSKLSSKPDGRAEHCLAMLGSVYQICRSLIGCVFEHGLEMIRELE